MVLILKQEIDFSLFLHSPFQNVGGFFGVVPGNYIEDIEVRFSHLRHGGQPNC